MKFTIIKHISCLRVALTVVCLMFQVGVFAQADFNVVSGVVKDSRNKHRLVFASVSVPGTSIGIITNTDGEFTLKIPKSAGNTLEISHLGYHNKQFALDALPRDGVFYLSAASVMVEGVVVRPDNPRNIVKQAISHIYLNYSQIPMMLTGFYRETVKQRRDYMTIAEGITSIYKASYVGLQADRVRILKGRKGENVRRADTLAVKMQGGPRVALYVDVVKTPDLILSPTEMECYSYELVDMVSIDKQLNYVIEFRPVVEREYPLYQGKMYISVDDLAFSMLQYSLDMRDLAKATSAFVRRKPRGLIFEPKSTNYLVTYKKIDGRYQLNYLRIEVKFRADWRRRIFKSNYTIMSEMAITQRDSVNVEKFANKDTFRPNAVFSEKVNEYFDPDYWGNYNTIEPNESIQTAIKRYNRRFNRN